MGRFVPERILDNRELEEMVETSDEWIRDRTGIEQRRIADPSHSTSDLGAAALKAACEDADIPLEALDVLIVATSTPDTLFPSTACWVQQRLGLVGCAAFDVSAGCTGWLYAVELASALLANGNLGRSGTGMKIGVVAAEVMSKVVDWTDRSTCVLFGDGAAAAILAPSQEQRGLLASNWGADGTLAPILYMPAGGTRKPASEHTVAQREHSVRMEGNLVFRHAVRAMTGSTAQALADAGMTADDVDLLIPHQANIRIIEATRERVGVPKEKMMLTVSRYGNVSAATVPIALCEARAEGRVKPGTVLALTSFGTGLTWASMIWRW